jgi:type IV secretion system protein TrbG
MKQHRLINICTAIALLPQLAFGATDELADKYFSGSNPTLTPQEKAAMAIAKRWGAGTATGMKPVPGTNGTIRFMWGAQQPSIVCAVLQVCDVALQPGEQVNTIHLGDTSRWTVDPAITGSGAAEVQHLIIKPHDVGLETSLVVTTNRRSYHLRLRSHRAEYMPQVSFMYPEDALSKWEAIKTRERQERTERTIPQTGEYLGELSFEYELSGSAPWKPVRVYNDGRKTIIELPGTMQQIEAPSLLVVRKEGGLFSDDETVIVNYRVQGNRYIVDAVFDRAILIAGVGGSQDRITIARRK